MTKCPVCNSPYGFIDSILSPDMCKACYGRRPVRERPEEAKESGSRADGVIVESRQSATAAEISNSATEITKNVFILAMRIVGAVIVVGAFLKLVVIFLLFLGLLSTDLSLPFKGLVMTGGVVVSMVQFIGGALVIILSRWFMNVLSWDMR